MGKSNRTRRKPSKRRQRGGLRTQTDFGREFEDELSALVGEHFRFIGYGWDDRIGEAKELLRRFEGDKRTAVFQYAVQNLDVAVAMKRGDWCLWVIQARPDLYGASYRNSENRQNSNRHEMDTLIYKYTQQKSAELVGSLPKAPAAGASKEAWVAHSKALEQRAAALLRASVDPAEHHRG
jgi:hypothetical protein